VQHFGLGDEAEAREIRVRWPSGADTALYDLPGDRRHVVAEPAAP
jgi:hypothetical protein